MCVGLARDFELDSATRNDTNMHVLSGEIECHVRTFYKGNACIVSMVWIEDSVKSSKCTQAAVELVDLLAQNNSHVVVLAALNVPVKEDALRKALFAQYNVNSKVLQESYILTNFPQEKWQLNNQFICSFLHFARVEGFPLTLLAARGYRVKNYSSPIVDGTDEVRTFVAHKVI